MESKDERPDESLRSINWHYRGKPETRCGTDVSLKVDLVEVSPGLPRSFSGMATYPANLCRLWCRLEFTDFGEDLGQAIRKSIKAMP